MQAYHRMPHARPVASPTGHLPQAPHPRPVPPVPATSAAAVVVLLPLAAMVRAATSCRHATYAATRGFDTLPIDIAPAPPLQHVTGSYGRFHGPMHKFFGKMGTMSGHVFASAMSSTENPPSTVQAVIALTIFRCQCMAHIWAPLVVPTPRSVPHTALSGRCGGLCSHTPVPQRFLSCRAQTLALQASFPEASAVHADTLPLCAPCFQCTCRPFVTPSFSCPRRSACQCTDGTQFYTFGVLSHGTAAKDG